MDKKKIKAMMASMSSMQKQLSDMIGQTEDPNMDEMVNPDKSLKEDEGYTVEGDGDVNEAVPDAGDGAIGMDEDEKSAKKAMVMAMMKKKMKG